VANETVKRWSIIGGLLAITIWLAMTAPEESDSYDVVGVSANRSDNKVKKDPQSTEELGDRNPDEIKLTERSALNDKPFDIFATQKAPIIKKVVPKVKKQPQIKTTAATPRAPRIPFRYIGQLAEKGRVKLFLMEGEALHIVSKGDNIGKTYRVADVNVDEINLLYLPLNITQVMNIGKAP